MAGHILYCLWKNPLFSPRLPLFGQKHSKYSKSSNIVSKTKIISLWSDFLMFLKAPCCFESLLLTKTTLTW